MKKGLSKRNIDLLLILAWPIVSVMISFLFRLNLFFSIMLFYLVPSLFLSIKMKKEMPKAALFAAIFIPVYIITDSIGTLSNSWQMPTMFIFNIFGATVEGIIWGFLTIYFIIMFYEYFISHHINHGSSKKIKYLIISLLSAFCIFLITFFNHRISLDVPYYYLLTGIIFILIPVILELMIYRKLAKKLILTASYFFYFHLIYEITALRLNWWSFPDSGNFIAWIDMGSIKMPYEEFIFYVLFGALAALSYFEFFDNDQK